MKTYVLCNQKGGVSKTTTAAALSYGLHAKGKRVLMIDLDPQENLFFSTGLKPSGYTLYDVFKRDCELSEALNTIEDGLDILYIGLGAAGIDMEMAATISREYMLREELERIKADYDYCIIDTAPALGLLQINSLTAADGVIIPLCADIYSLQGIDHLRRFIKDIQAKTNKSLKVMGLLLTKYKPHRKLSKELIDTVFKAAECLDTTVFETTIPEAAAVQKAQATLQSIYDYSSKDPAATSYIEFVEELLEKEIG